MHFVLAGEARGVALVGHEQGEVHSDRVLVLVGVEVHVEGEQGHEQGLGGHSAIVLREVAGGAVPRRRDHVY